MNRSVSRSVSILKTVSMIALGALLVALPFARPAKADLTDQKTIVTFSAPVAIPGQVLPAGTYVFRLASLPLERDVVQIFDADDVHLITTLMTVPVIWQTAPDQSVITLGESAAGTPPQIRDYMYAGMTTGHHFLY